MAPVGLWEPCYSAIVPYPQTYIIYVLWLQEENEEEEGFLSKGTLSQGPLHGTPRREILHH